jgi:hypothetical protein
MIELKDVIMLWMTTNKNISRSWEMIQDPDDTWVLKPKNVRHYKVNTRAPIHADYMRLHHDDDAMMVTPGQSTEKACHTEIIQAYDPAFFQKLMKWMRLVRRR